VPRIEGGVAKGERLPLAVAAGRGIVVSRYDERAMSEHAIIALVMLGAIGLPMVICGIISLFKQKIHVGADGKPIMNELNIPKLGKLKTNTAAGLLAGLGACVVFMAYLVEKTGIESLQPKLVTFRGEITLDEHPEPEIPSITIGLTSGSWFQTSTPNTGDRTIVVQLTVPNSWPSYSAYAFAPGSSRVRPKIIGTSLEDPKFSLKVGP
jgi:hypothetical protein